MAGLVNAAGRPDLRSLFRVIIVSDGQPTAERRWRVQPSVWLVLLSTIGRILLEVSFSQGVTIS